MHLALKKTPATSLSSRILCALIKWRLTSEYCHAGIAIDGTMYHCNYDRGMYLSGYNPDEWDLCEIKNADKERVKALFEQHKGAKYDWFGILAFVLPFRLQKKRSLYCFEWCYLCITNSYPPDRVTPEKLLKILLDNHA